jgi:hypothetical protein
MNKDFGMDIKTYSQVKRAEKDELDADLDHTYQETDKEIIEKVKVITAIEDISEAEGITIFLAGTITNAPDWQKEVIKMLKEKGFAGTIFNPRRENFPIEDPNASKEQIAWEFNAITKADIFSIWFSNTPKSESPICLYELGRNVAKRESDLESVIIGVEPGYKREADVKIQMGLVNPKLSEGIVSTLQDFVDLIIKKARSYDLKQ